MVEVIKYDKHFYNEWNNFIESSYNGTFLFHRDYMEYHSDRFNDFSLMFYLNDKLATILPANSKEQTIYSHGGLTYGGLIYAKLGTEQILEIFNQLTGYLRSQSFKKLIYKAIPSFYHTKPAEQDLYALFINNGVLYRRDISSTVLLSDYKISANRKQGYKKALNMGMKFEEQLDLSEFLAIVNKLLINKYNTSSVHNLTELKYLSSKFPKNISMFSVIYNNELLSGAIIYESHTTAHAQYLYSSDLGKQFRSMDFLIINLLNYYQDKKTYFDFGISTEDEGKYLNTNLIRMKEDFGATGKVYDAYQIDLA